MRHPKLAALDRGPDCSTGDAGNRRAWPQPFPFDPRQFRQRKHRIVGERRPGHTHRGHPPAVVGHPHWSTGLDHPWDVVAAPDGAILTGTTIRRILRSPRRQHDRSSPLLTFRISTRSPKPGLMGIALARDFAQSPHPVHLPRIQCWGESRTFE